MKIILQCVTFLLIAGNLIAGADELISKFLKLNCIRCHGSEKQKADRRFDTLSVKIKALDDLERYQEIVDLSLIHI